MISSLQVLRLKFYIHFMCSIRVLYVPFISSYLILITPYFLTSTNFEAPLYVIFSVYVLFPLSYVLTIWLKHTKPMFFP